MAGARWDRGYAGKTESNSRRFFKPISFPFPIKEDSGTTRRTQVSWAEFEVPDAPRRAQVSWSELEVPTAPRRTQVSWVEFEIPNAPRRVQVSWSELETPDAPVTTRSVQVSWSELEVPNGPRRTQVSWVEFEVPNAPATRRTQISWIEFEVPDEFGSSFGVHGHKFYMAITRRVTSRSLKMLPAREPWAAFCNMVAADSTKVLVASPGAARRLVVQGIGFTVTVLAAQAFDVESDDGVVEFFKIPASFAVGLSPDAYFGDLGIPLAPNVGLRVQPAAAGPGVNAFAFGYIEKTSY